MRSGAQGEEGRNECQGTVLKTKKQFGRKYNFGRCAQGRIVYIDYANL